MKQKFLFFLLILLLGSAGAFADGTININSPSSGDGYTWSSPVLTIMASGNYTITGSGTTNNRIEVASGVTDVNITIENVNINVAGYSTCAFFIAGGSTVNLTLSGNNVLTSGSNHAGLEVPDGATLTITGGSLDDKLTANSDDFSYGTGIGGSYEGSCGTITISGGTIVAFGNFGAGIGAGYKGSCGAITISGGMVEATNNYSGAGIGGGGVGSGGIIKISGGMVTAISKYDGAGIGGGTRGDGGNITITGGTVEAISKNGSGAGIGGGYKGSGGAITISGGMVTANGGNFGGAGIGGGGEGSGGIIKISDGIVTATGGQDGAGIGGGYLNSDGGDGGDITISGGMVIATSGRDGAGIGGARHGDGGNITITGGIVEAISKYGGAGIGGGAGTEDGDKGDGGAITISGGTVTANGSYDGAGIGGGYKGSGGDITISGGTVTANGGNFGGAGIGGGLWDDGGTISISGGTVIATGKQNGAGIGGGDSGGSGGDITITGGTVKATGGSNGNIQSQPTDGEGHDVYLNILTVGSNTNSGKSIPAGSINGTDCAEIPDAASGIYGINDVKTDDSGKVYFYLPESDGDELVALTVDGISYEKSYKREANNDNAQTLELIQDVPLKDLKLLKDLEDVIVCVGESHTFEFEAEGESLSYEWYYGNERIKGANGNTYTITNAEFRDYERYYVIVRSQIGSYRSSIYSKNVRLWVADQLPENLRFVEFPSTVFTGNTYRIKLAGYPDVTQYAWDCSNDGVTFSPATGGIGQNETQATFGATSVGQGMLTVTLTHPCGARQATQAIVVQYPTGVEQVAETAVQVFPNPTTGIIKVSGTKSNQVIRIVDITGSLKGSYSTQDGETTIDLAGFTKGIYLVYYGGKAVKVIRK
jgi:hypothetical protein